jgi:hypothetical protein
MAFGWAYVDCSGSTGGGGQAAGPTGSVQFLTGANATSGSTSFLFYTSSYTEHTANTLVLSGNLVVTGAISASHYRINNVTIIESTGSTFFGDTNDDIHIRTGSLYVGPTGGGTADVLRVDVSSKAVEVRGFNVEYTPITAASYTASAPTYILGVQRTGVVSILIPSASAYGTGSILLVKDEVGHTDGTDITINASTGYTIDGTTNYVLTGSNPAISLYSNGANWFVF